MDVNAIESYPHAKIDLWEPALPQGRIDRLYLHWSAGNYRDVFPAYHFCVATDDDGDVVVVNTHDITENMRDVSLDPERPYAAHTRGRNGYALGLSIMGMKDSTPHDFGQFPLLPPLIEGLCLVAARLAAFYKVPIDADHILSHAEAAAAEGYFGTGNTQRWDIARLAPEPRPLVIEDAARTGDRLRQGIRDA